MKWVANNLITSWTWLVLGSYLLAWVVTAAGVPFWPWLAVYVLGALVIVLVIRRRLRTSQKSNVDDRSDSTRSVGRTTS